MAKDQEKSGALQALKAEIKEKRFGRLYFFHGEEGFLRHYYLEQMKKILIDELTESFNYHKLTPETFDIQSFADAVENMPMMSEHTFVWVDEVDVFKQSEDVRDKLAQLLSDIPEYCTVVFTYDTVAWKPDKRYTKLYDAVQKHGTEVSFDKQEQRDLVAWITRHFAAEHKRITPDLCCYLIEITGGTMTALAGEISKICAYSGSEQIVKADIDAVTEPVLEAVVFQMTDMISRGNYAGAVQKLHQLMKLQHEPVLILGAIGSHYRKIGTAKTLLEQGKSYSDLMPLYNMRDYAAKKTADLARGVSTRFCKAASELILETDYAIKTSYADPERLLEQLILRLAMEAKNG